MNKLILSLCLLAGFLPAVAQKQYFIYLQSENNQAFYARMGEKTYSSTGTGYLILSKIPDSTINLKIGFATERAPEQVYAIAVKRRDHGFIIKHFGDKGWGLFDLQDLSVVMSTAVTRTNSSGKASVMNTSMFAEILARASDDPSLKEAVVRTEVPKPEIVLVKNTDKPKQAETPASQPETVKADERKGTAAEKETPKEPAVVKTADKKDSGKEDALAKTEISNPATEPGKKEVVAEKEAPKETTVVKTADKNSSGKEDAVVKTETTKPVVEPEKKPDAIIPVSARPHAITETTIDKTKAEPKEKEKKEDTGNAVVKDQSSTNAGNSPAAVHVNETAKTKNDDKAQEEKKNVKTAEESEKKDKTVAEETPYKKSVVSKRSESSTSQGFGVTYIDAYADGTRDTVSIVIPESKPIVPVVKEEPKEEKKFLDISSEKKATDTAAARLTVTNTCNYQANNNDFFKLRKDMAAAEGDDAMITLAKKYFRLKCYTVAQVKSLGALFLEDEGKYQFYDAVYRHTSDPANFGTLESELKDAYYVNRFKAMLRN